MLKRRISGNRPLFNTARTVCRLSAYIVRAWKADTYGNLVFRMTARNFSPLMAMAAKVTIVAAEHVVQPGELDPNDIHTPSIFVQRVVAGQTFQKWIEKKTVRKRGEA